MPSRDATFRSAYVPDSADGIGYIKERYGGEAVSEQSRRLEEVIAELRPLVSKLDAEGRAADVRKMARTAERLIDIIENDEDSPGMTREEFESLKPGDYVRPVGRADGWMVHANFLGHGVVVIRAHLIHNPREWERV